MGTEYQKCRRCGSTNIDTDLEGSTICQNCGLVIDEDNIRAEVELTNEGEFSRPIGRVVSATSNTSTLSSVPFGMRRPSSLIKGQSNSPVYYHISRIGALLQLNPNLIAQMRNLHDAITSGKSKYCRSPELLAAGIAYVILRKNNKPYTLLDIADKVQCSVFELGRVYKRIVKSNKIGLEDIDPAVFIDRTLSALSATQEQINKVRDQAMRLITVAQRMWLGTGRRPSAITAAAIILSFEANGYKILPKSVGDPLHIGEQTVRQRVRELKEALVQAARSLPWGGDITVKNVLAHLPFLLQHLEILSKATNSPNCLQAFCGSDEPEIEDKQDSDTLFPPALRNNKKAQARRCNKILKAKQRIAAVLQHDASARETLGPLFNLSTTQSSSPESMALQPASTIPEDIDEEDLLIERMLLEGVDEEVLLNGYYNVATAAAIVPNKSVLDCLQEEGEGEMLGEADIPECEMNKFIRSEEEVQALQELVGIDEPPSKRARPTLAVA
jgi:transcription initiation factor TFIIB